MKHRASPRVHRHVLALLLLSLTAACVDERVVFQDRELFEEPLSEAGDFLGYTDTDDKLTVCGNCHVGSQAEWVETAHADAWDGLQDSGHAQAFCEGCHTVSELGNVSTGTVGHSATGEVRYQVSDDLASYAAVKLATVGGRRWGFVFGRTGLLGFEPSTGRLDFAYVWRAPVLESVNAATPVVVGNRVLITESYGVGSSLLAVRPGGYEVVWKDPPRRGQSLASHWATPIHHDGVVYASSGRNSGDAELRAVRFETGEVLWSEPRLQRASLLSVDGHLIALSEDGRLRLLRVNPEKYDPVAELVLRDGTENLLAPPAWNAPVLAHGILYLLGKDRLVAVELIAE